jgi:hypothetical protein
MSKLTARRFFETRGFDLCLLCTQATLIPLYLYTYTCIRFIEFQEIRTSEGTMTARKDQIIKQLNLLPLSEEGGFFKETYRSPSTLKIDEFDEKGNQCSRNVLTTIYYLISDDTGGRDYLNRNKSDHVHFFHCGWPLEYTIVSPEDEILKFVLGPDPSKGDMFQLTVRGGYLKAARLMTERTECEIFPNETPFALISEAVAPGFDYKDRCCYNREQVEKLYPKLCCELMEHVPPS